MAAEEGIDRKMEERMEFSTSREVSVAPTFEAMYMTSNGLIVPETRTNHFHTGT